MPEALAATRVGKHGAEDRRCGAGNIWPDRRHRRDLGVAPIVAALVTALAAFGPASCSGRPRDEGPMSASTTT